MSEIKFVLGNFTAEESPLIEEAVVAARNAAVDVIGHGLDWAMNHYN
jgi:peptidyl-tRNA hydrolase